MLPAVAAPERRAVEPVLAHQPTADGAMDSFLTALQGEAAEAVPALCLEAADARNRFAALLSTPGLSDLISRDCGTAVSNSNQAFVWTGDPGRPSIPGIAAMCAEMLRLLAPRLLASDEQTDQQRLLASFSERYDTLLAQYEALQGKCQSITEREDCHNQLTQEVQAWQSAYHAATARVEELSLESADLKERARALNGRGVDPAEKRELLGRLAQREAEISAASDAMRRLQEVLEDGDGAAVAQCAELERKLHDAHRTLRSTEATCEAESARALEACEVAAAASAHEQELVARCRAAEAEARECSAALEMLLEEKGRYLDERENFIDRRLVTSMLALYMDHQASGQGALAEQVLGRTLQVLGAAPAVEARQQLRAAAAAAEVRLAGPLGDAFLDFLTQETS